MIDLCRYLSYNNSMKKAANTIEDLLEIFAGMHQAPKLEVNSSDATIMYSIARQTFKGTALTDRQLVLMKEKLQAYRDQFVALDYNFDIAIENLRQPIRHIDRSKYIKIVSHADMVGPNQPYESYKESWKWIKVRFPFSKKDIVKLEPIITKAKLNRNDYSHTKGTHEHFFLLKESYVYLIVEAFKNANFVVDEDTTDIYNQLVEFESNREEYVPGVYNYKLKNVREVVAETLEQLFEKPDVDNLLLYKDRSLLYGLQEFDKDELAKSSRKYSDLAVKIAMRNTGRIVVDSNTYRIQHLIDSLIELERFPILVLCDETNAEEQLVTTHKIFKNRILDSEISVMFRLEGDHELNKYVKDKGLNNFVDKNTKVVYINKNKLPKPLLTADWNFNCVLSLTSLRSHSKVDAWIEGTDLNVSHDTNESNYMFRLGYHGTKTKTEKIT